MAGPLGPRHPGSSDFFFPQARQQRSFSFEGGAETRRAPWFVDVFFGTDPIPRIGME